MTRRHAIARGFAAAAMTAAAAPAAADLPGTGRHAVTVFAAQLTDNKWTQIATLDDVSLRHATLVGGAVSREIFGGRDWAIELEGQTAKHFGAQTHWEFNGVLLARWRGFPWRDSLPTSVAFGAGPSYATEVPAEEIGMDGSSARLLLYWTAELEIGLPNRPWSAIARLHHRSNAYGAFAETGGSNWLTLGVRYRF